MSRWKVITSQTTLEFDAEVCQLAGDVLCFYADKEETDIIAGFTKQQLICFIRSDAQTEKPEPRTVQIKNKLRSIS